MSEISERRGIEPSLWEEGEERAGVSGLATALRQKKLGGVGVKREMGKERPLLPFPYFLTSLNQPNMSLDFHDNLPKPK